MEFDLFKAFSWIDGSRKFDFLSSKRPVFFHTFVTRSELPSIIGTMKILGFINVRKIVSKKVRNAFFLLHIHVF